MRVDVERLVGGNGPGRGGPNHGKCGGIERGQPKGGGQLAGVGALKGHVDGRALLVLVFDFEFGQGAAAIEAPVDGLQTPIDKAALDHALECADFASFVLEAHGFVGVVPFSQHAQALEIDHLLRDLLGGKGAALGLHLIAAQVAAMQFFDGVFNRQTVAVPARNVVRIHALELTRLDDHVLEHLVDGVADVDLAIGVGRTVVQNEPFLAFAGFAQLFIESAVVPLLDPPGLAPGQVATHRERGIWQVEGFAVIGFLVGHDAGESVQTAKRALAGSARTACGRTCEIDDWSPCHKVEKQLPLIA